MDYLQIENLRAYHKTTSMANTLPGSVEHYAWGMLDRPRAFSTNQGDSIEAHCGLSVKYIRGKKGREKRENETIRFKATFSVEKYDIKRKNDEDSK